MLTLEASSDRIHRRGSLSNIFTNVKIKLHRDKSNSPNSSSDDGHNTAFSCRSRTAQSSATLSGTDSTGNGVSHNSFAANCPQLEALPESPPTTVKGSTFAEAFHKAADDIKTKYESFPIEQPSSFNPNISKTMPVRRKTKTQRLVSGSKSLFRSKAQRRARIRRSDQRSSETDEGEVIPNPKDSNSTSPNWVPVLSADQISAQVASVGPIPKDVGQSTSPNEPEGSHHARTFSDKSDTRSLHRQCAIYLDDTPQEEQKVTDILKRRQAKLENLRNWPFEQTSVEVPNNAETSTEESPFLVQQPIPATKHDGEPSSSAGKDGSEDLLSSGEAELDGDTEVDEEPVTLEVPFPGRSDDSLPLIELCPSKVDEPDYRGSPEGFHSQKMEEAVNTTVTDIQEPTSTFTYVPIATTEAIDAVEQSNKQRAQIEAVISSRRPAANPFSSPLDPYFDEEKVGGDHVIVRVNSSTVSLVSCLGGDEQD